jgi:hypothetical protein
MIPITREVETSYDGPTVACPSCRARTAISAPTGWSVRSPQDVYAHLGVELAALEREELRILLLNSKNAVLRVVTAYAGNVSASLVRVGEPIREAVRDTSRPSFWSTTIRPAIRRPHVKPVTKLGRTKSPGGSCRHLGDAAVVE